MVIRASGPECLIGFRKFLTLQWWCTAAREDSKAMTSTGTAADLTRLTSQSSCSESYAGSQRQVLSFYRTNTFCQIYTILILLYAQFNQLIFLTAITRKLALIIEAINIQALTTMHLVFQTIATRLLRKYTNLVDGSKELEATGKMNRSVFLWKIVPIAGLFSASLILSNWVYTVLAVSYIQMVSRQKTWHSRIIYF